MAKRVEKQRRKAKIKIKCQSERSKETARKGSVDENAEFDRILEKMLLMDRIQTALEQES